MIAALFVYITGMTLIIISFMTRPQKYEYGYLEYVSKHDVTFTRMTDDKVITKTMDGDPIEHIMYRLSKEGWMLCATSLPVSKALYYTVYHFQRPIR